MEDQTVATKPTKRLLSLDVMRGLDMFFLVVVGPILGTCQRIWGLPQWLTTQLRHVDWEGLTAWDLIMPMFIFMCGAAIPFALAKRLENGRATWGYWRYVLGRVALLWVLGMMVQGNLLSLNPNVISPFNNTLQAIAVGYLMAACVYLIPNRLIRYALPFLMAIGYGAILRLFGDYSLEGCIAIRIDQILLPMNRDGYSWVLTSLMFGVMTLCGMFCTTLLISKSTPVRKLLTLATVGMALLFGGLALGIWEPAIKRVYTVSFTSQAMGWCILILTLLYAVIDVCRFNRGWGLFLLYGRYALTAYLCGTLFWHALNVLSATLVHGVVYWWGDNAFYCSQTFVATLLLTGVLGVQMRLKQRG